MNDFVLVQDLGKQFPDIGRQVRQLIAKGEIRAERITHLPGRPYAVPKAAISHLQPRPVPTPLRAKSSEPLLDGVSKDEALRIALRLLEMVVA